MTLWAYKHCAIRYRQGCGDTAFYLAERPAAGNPVRRSAVRLLDRKTVPERREVKCYACGAPIGAIFSALASEVRE